MKKEILEKLRKIEKVAKETGFEGKISLTYTEWETKGEWEKIIESITEYPRIDHLFTVSEGVTVYLLLN